MRLCEKHLNEIVAVLVGDVVAAGTVCRISVAKNKLTGAAHKVYVVQHHPELQARIEALLHEYGGSAEPMFEKGPTA